MKFGSNNHILLRMNSGNIVSSLHMSNTLVYDLMPVQLMMSQFYFVFDA